MKNEARFNGNRFRERYWQPAFEKAGLPYRRPYAMRHTFAAWCLVLGIHMNRLVARMGHASKKMVYEVHWQYVEGVGRDAEAIRQYFGEDFA